MSNFKKNTVHEVEIESLAFGGLGVAKPEGFVVFVEGGIPGDRIQARIIKKTKNHARALIQEIVEPSPKRIEARCPLFHRCGGCTWQDLGYEEQLGWKQRQVAETLRQIGGIGEDVEFRPIIASPEVWNYRNKMEYSFGTDDEGQTILGFHIPKSYHRIFAVDRCLIHPEPYDALLGALTAYAREHSLSAYDQRSHGGFLRHAVMRYSRSTGKVVLILITASGKLPDPENLAKTLRAACPELQGFIWGINDGVADVAFMREKRFSWGDPVLRDNLNGLDFRISPFSFFQTNPSAAEKLYLATVELADLGPEDCVLDAFCGTGSIALHCARHVRQVVGVEIGVDAVHDARRNAHINGIKNASFVAAPVREGLELGRGLAGGYFSHVIIDPPRGGMDKKSLSGLIALKAQTFIYVSCNPSTLARDLEKLADNGYRVEVVQPVDMFPHTYHIEVIVRLRLHEPSESPASPNTPN